MNLMTEVNPGRSERQGLRRLSGSLLLPSGKPARGDLAWSCEGRDREIDLLNFPDSDFWLKSQRRSVLIPRKPKTQAAGRKAKGMAKSGSIDRAHGKQRLIVGPGPHPAGDLNRPGARKAEAHRHATSPARWTALQLSLCRHATSGRQASRKPAPSASRLTKI